MSSMRLSATISAPASCASCARWTWRKSSRARALARERDADADLMAVGLAACSCIAAAIAIIGTQSGVGVDAVIGACTKAKAVLGFRAAHELGGAPIGAGTQAQP